MTNGSCAFCAELGFRFEPVWAYFMPLEKLLAFDRGGAFAPELNEEYRAIIDRLGIDLPQALAASRARRAQPCSLLENQLTLESKGDVILCCSVYDVKGHEIASFLETPTADS